MVTGGYLKLTVISARGRMETKQDIKMRIRKETERGHEWRGSDC